jgi:competence protein ComEC
MEIVLISFLFGLYWGRYLKNICSFFIALGSIGVILYLQNKKRLIFIFITISILAFMYMNYFEKSYDKIPENAEIEIQAEIVSLKIKGEYKDKYIVKSKYGKKFYLYVNTKKEFDYGDIVEVKGNFSKVNKATNEYCFDYREFLKHKKIYGNIMASKVNLLRKNSMLCKISKVKIKLNKYIDENYSDTASGFLKTLLLGETNEIEKEIKEDFTKANISHILAISGMHISIIILVIKNIMQILKFDQRLEKIFLNLLIICYIFFIDYPISAIRVAITQVILLITFFTNRKSNFYNTISITLFIILLLNPYNIESTAMQLSFGGICGIYLFYKFIKKMFFYKFCIQKKTVKEILKENTKENRNIRKNIKNICQTVIKSNKLKQIVIDSLCLNISVQIFIFPIVWYKFNFISITSFIPSILISLFIFPILILGYLSFFEIFIQRFISISIISKINNFIILKMLNLVSILSKIPLLSIYLKKPNKIFIVSYYVVLILCIKIIQKDKLSELLHIWRIKSGKAPIKQYIRVKFKKNNDFKRIVLIVILNIVIIFQSFVQDNFLKNGVEIYFLDVGQGDSTIIRTAKNKTIVIDGGEGEKSGFDYGKNVLFPFLINKGVRKIDFLIFSHFDSDHCGGLIYLLENIKVEKILIGKQFEKNENFEYIVNLANKKDIKIIELQAGNKINIEKNSSLEILWPSVAEKISENAINNNSLVCKFVYKNFSMLLTGDIESIAEEKLLGKYKNTNRLNANILKIAHHGSKTSSIQEFLNEVNPKIALIGVGRKNKFGHPNQEVLERLKEKGIQIYRTDQNGEIQIIVKNNFKIKTFLSY